MPSWIVKTPPTSLPVTTDEARDHLRILGEDGQLNATVERAIASATELVERDTDRAIVPRTLLAYFDRFPEPGEELTLPITPAIDVVAVTYTDPEGNTQALSASTYAADTVREPGRVVLVPGESWPETRIVPNAVSVEYNAGYETVPEDLIAAVLLTAGHFVEHPQATSSIAVHEVPMGVDRILSQYRRPRVA